MLILKFLWLVSSTAFLWVRAWVRGGMGVCGRVFAAIPCIRRVQVLRKKYWNAMEDMKGKIRVYARCRPFAQ